MSKITVIIPCYNNEEIIRDCLETVKWADEILVCDSYSTDRTLEIVKEYTDKIIQHKYINSAIQKNWAIPQAKNEWVLIIDTDERVSLELKNEILSILKSHTDFDGFKIPRANYSFGKYLKHGGYWPDYQLRLFKRDKGMYQPREVHAHMIVDGKIGYLKNPIIHLPERRVSQVIEKYFLRYAKWEAKERLKRENPSIFKLIFSPPAVFTYRYILKMGFLDGVAGFVAACFWTIYIFLTYLYMWQWEENE
jgi:glycosyltransferase involved in cell wall biosynthesis